MTDYDFKLNDEIDTWDLCIEIENEKCKMTPFGDEYFWADTIEIIAAGDNGRITDEPCWVDYDPENPDTLLPVLEAARRCASETPDATTICISGQLRVHVMYDGCDEPEEEPGHEWWSIDLKV
jgi:hypothetical protein